MRIGIDASPLIGDRGGVGWYTFHLLRSMLDLKEQVQFVLYVESEKIGRLPGDVRAWSSREGVRWVEAGRWEVRGRGHRDGLDLYHGLNFKMRTTGRYGGVVTIHDLWRDRYPQYSVKLLGQRVSFYRTRRTAWRARKVITVSESTAHDMEELYGLPRTQIVVIHNGVSEEFYPEPATAGLDQLLRRLAVQPQPYLLFVGGADPRKNHRVLLEACERKRDLLRGRRLIAVGNAEHRFGDIRATARRLGLADLVVCAGRCSVPELRSLYSHAELFVFPSLYEGFGMPILEAMACGAPVITSSTTALPEVAGDAALLVDPQDAEALAEAMTRVIQDPGLREALKAKGRDRVRQFTWRRAAQQTLDVYRSLCET